MKSKFLAISLSLTFGLSVFSQEIQLEDVPEPNAISVKDIRKVAIAEFKCEQCFPEEALERLVEIIEKKGAAELLVGCCQVIIDC
jgi:hypothetical protein